MVGVFLEVLHQAGSDVDVVAGLFEGTQDGGIVVLWPNTVGQRKGRGSGLGGFRWVEMLVPADGCLGKGLWRGQVELLLQLTSISRTSASPVQGLSGYFWASCSSAARASSDLSVSV